MIDYVVIALAFGLVLLWLRIHRLEDRAARRRNRSSREW